MPYTALILYPKPKVKNSKGIGWLEKYGVKCPNIGKTFDDKVKAELWLREELKKHPEAKGEVRGG